MKPLSALHVYRMMLYRY